MHRVCVISDDFYYLVGLEEITFNDVDTIFFTDIKTCLKEILGRAYTLYIISIRSLAMSRELVCWMSEKKPAITLVYDIPVEKLYSHSRCLSKRDSIESINRFLSDSAQGRKKEKNNITPRQMVIVKRLASGDTVKSIAREDNRSIKTVSAIKNSILVKIGLKPMNDLSLLIVDMIICSAGFKKNHMIKTIQQNENVTSDFDGVPSIYIAQLPESYKQ